MTDFSDPKWDKAKFMCDCYGYDIREIEAGLQRFRALNRPARERALAGAVANLPAPQAAPAKLAHFNSVRKFWDAHKQQWTRSGLVYIGRAMPNPHLNLPQSLFGNPFRILEDTDEQRDVAIELYTEWLLQPGQAEVRRQLDNLRGMTLVCWCAPRRCHGDVLIQLMRERMTDATAELQTQVSPAAVEGGTTAFEGSGVRRAAPVDSPSKPHRVAQESQRQPKLQI